MVQGKECQIQNFDELCKGKECQIQNFDELCKGKECQIQNFDELCKGKECQIQNFDELCKEKSTKFAPNMWCIFFKCPIVSSVLRLYSYVESLSSDPLIPQPNDPSLAFI